MSPLLLLSLLTLSLFVPTFSSDIDIDDLLEGNDDTDADAGTRVEGTEDGDLLTAGQNDTVDAGAGEDTIGVEDDITGAVLNGQDGADQITLSGDGNIANGGLGQDTIILSGQNTANGDEGDDTITATTSDDDTFAIVDGDGGEDLLIKEYGQGTGDLRVQFNGGNGNDTLQAELQLGEELTDETDSLTGGALADTFTLQLIDTTEGEAPAGGLITGVEITDFDPTEDALIFDTSALAPEGETRTVDSTILNAADDGSYTDVVVAFVEDATPVTLRLFGVSGLAADDVTFATA